MKTIDIVFDGPPGPESGRFVEVERDGKSVALGEWVMRPDGHWALRIPDPGLTDASACAPTEKLFMPFRADFEFSIWAANGVDAANRVATRLESLATLLKSLPPHVFSENSTGGVQGSGMKELEEGAKTGDPSGIWKCIWGINQGNW